MLTKIGLLKKETRLPLHTEIKMLKQLHFIIGFSTLNCLTFLMHSVNMDLDLNSAVGLSYSTVNHHLKLLQIIELQCPVLTLESLEIAVRNHKVNDAKSSILVLIEQEEIMQQSSTPFHCI